MRSTFLFASRSLSYKSLSVFFIVSFVGLGDGAGHYLNPSFAAIFAKNSGEAPM